MVRPLVAKKGQRSQQPPDGSPPAEPAPAPLDPAAPEPTPAAPRRFRWTRGRRDAVLALGLAVAIALGWMEVCQFFKDQTFSDPISYRGDAYLTAAAVAVARRGDWSPFGSKVIPSLGAPFVASWNDYPSTDDVIIWAVGLLARLTDTIVAVNLGFMLACVSSGLALFWVARRLGFRREGALMAGFTYGLAHFIFVRTVHHFTLTFIAAIPLDVLVMLWLGSRKGLPFRSSRFKVAALAAVLSGWSFVYFIFFAAQLFALGGLAGLFRHGRRWQWRPVAALAGIFLAAVLSVTSDSLRWVAANGPNQAAVARGATDGEYFALKPVNLFVGFHQHQLGWMREAWQRNRAQSIIHGEEPGPYLGLTGGPLLVALALTGMASLSRRLRPRWPLAFAAAAAWFLIAHAVGGLNGVMSLFNLYLFRSTNRASVVLVALVLLFGAWAVPWALQRLRLPRPVRWLACAGLAGLALLDLHPLRGPSEAPENHRQVENDRHLAAAMEKALPPGSMVFQLPAMGFPEVGPAHAVDVYELFRPYYFADTLRFSHGDVKGRPSAEWKFSVAALPPPELVAALRAKGFAAVLLNRKGFPDGGLQLIEGLRAAGARLLLQSELGESVLLGL